MYSYVVRKKVVVVHAVTAYRERKDSISLIINLRTRWRLVVTFALVPSYPRERAPVGLRAGVDAFGGLKTSWLAGIRTRSVQPYLVAIPTTLSRFLSIDGQMLIEIKSMY